MAARPLGPYTYWLGLQAGSNPSPLHAALAVGSGYTAAYDAAGDMTCRAPTSSTTCAAQHLQTGAQLSYDNERRLVHWQNAPGSGVTPSADEGYDGEGKRVEEVYHTSSATTTLYLAGGLEEVGTGGTLTRYYPVAGLPTAVKVGFTISYLATDGLGTISVAVDSSGNMVSTELFMPYGAGFYASGVMPTSRQFTGQYTDVGYFGFDYYNARFYDPSMGQFASADSGGDGLNEATTRQSSVVWASAASTSLRRLCSAASDARRDHTTPASTSMKRWMSASVL